MNDHPQYAGMSLRDSTELIDGIPTWIECTIYRNDRILPIVIKEYFEEVKTDHPSWQQMPRRMLRHRVIQQCARLALGIAASDPRVQAKFSTQEKGDSTNQDPNKYSHSRKQTDILKQNLSTKYF